MRTLSFRKRTASGETSPCPARNCPVCSGRRPDQVGATVSSVIRVDCPGFSSSKISNTSREPSLVAALIVASRRTRRSGGPVRLAGNATMSSTCTAGRPTTVKGSEKYAMLSYQTLTTYPLVLSGFRNARR